MGYLNRPELTAEKFIEVDLFDKRQRLYKTGDQARWLTDGSLEYLGRLDHQIKLRGFRIELPEIEVVLRRHHVVKEAAQPFTIPTKIPASPPTSPWPPPSTMHPKPSAPGSIAPDPVWFKDVKPFERETEIHLK